MKPERLAIGELVAMMAFLFATIAFSIDAMLPALPEMAAELSPDMPNRAQLVIAAFVLGMGIGTVFAGPLSDWLGRLPVIAGGAALYIVSAFLALQTESLELLLVARFFQGMGVSGPRIAGQAIMRDLFEGRRMAQVASLVMTIFILVPAMAPTIGATLISLTGTWRSIFVAFILFGAFSAGWTLLRLRETLPVEKRRKISLSALSSATIEVLTNRMVIIYIVVLGLGFGQLLAMISSIQPIYSITYGRGESFHYWFMVSGVLAIGGTLINAALVIRLGMRRLTIAAFISLALASALLLFAQLAFNLPQTYELYGFFLFATAMFFSNGLTFGNLNALALQPLGHVAGLASSLITAISTVLSVCVAAPIGLAYNGTPQPLLIGTLVCSIIAALLMRKSRELDPTPKHEVGKAHG